MNINLLRQKKIYSKRRSPTLPYEVLYRFSEEQVDWLANEFLGECIETRGGRLTNKQRMHIFLRYMSDPGYQVGLQL